MSCQIFSGSDGWHSDGWLSDGWQCNDDGLAAVGMLVTGDRAALDLDAAAAEDNLCGKTAIANGGKSLGCNPQNQVMLPSFDHECYGFLGVFQASGQQIH